MRLLVSIFSSLRHGVSVGGGVLSGEGRRGSGRPDDMGRVDVLVDRAALRVARHRHMVGACRQRESRNRNQKNGGHKNGGSFHGTLLLHFAL